MLDFPAEKLVLGTTTDNWGPYKFSFPINSSATSEDGALPYGTTISDVTVKAYYKDTEIAPSTLVLDGDYTPTSGDDYVEARFCYPGSTYLNKKIDLVFILTLSNGAINPFKFSYLIFEE